MVTIDIKRKYTFSTKDRIFYTYNTHILSKPTLL